jgi:hypothetical protein
MKGKSISTSVKHNVMTSKEKFRLCIAIFIGVDLFVIKASESKTHAEQKKSKACMYTYVDADI